MFSSFGSSIPIRDLPGMGASIRTFLAAMLSIISSLKLRTLLTLTPTSGFISNRVMAGPCVYPVMVTPTPNSLSVSLSLSAFSLRTFLESPEASVFPFFNRDTGGNLKSFFLTSRGGLWDGLSSVLEYAASSTETEGFIYSFTEASLLS